jgi:hypothetical protein
VDQTAFTRTTKLRLRERLCLDRKRPDVIAQSGVSVGRRVPGFVIRDQLVAHAIEEEPWPDNPLLAEELLRFSRFRQLLEE